MEWAVYLESFMVEADSLEEALEKAHDWIDSNTPRIAEISELDEKEMVEK